MEFKPEKKAEEEVESKMRLVSSIESAAAAEPDLPAVESAATSSAKPYIQVEEDSIAIRAEKKKRAAFGTDPMSLSLPAKFVLFVAASYVTTVFFLIAYPPQVMWAFETATWRTALLCMFIWNLIGATLFSRTKVHKGDFALIAIYMCLPFLGIFMLGALFVRAFEKTFSPEYRSELKGQLVLICVFGLPAILWPVITPLLVTIWTLLFPR